MTSGVDFHEPSHTYTKNGVLVPGVTTVLNVLDLYAGIPAAVLQAAAERGTAVHKATELDDAGTLDEEALDDQLWPYLLAWREFRRDTGFTPRAAEAMVFHPKHWYAGQYDREGQLFGAECLIDIKTTAKLMPSTGPQLAAYKEARNYRRADKVGPRYAVQLKDDGSYVVKEYRGREDMGLFLACLTLYTWKANNS